jgi:hypothetical protein
MTEQQHKAHTYFKEQGFLPVTVETYPVLKAYEGESVLGEMTATMATVWAGSYNELYKIIQGYLCTVLFFEEGSVFFEIFRSQSRAVPYSLQEIVDTLYDLSVEAGLPFLQIYAIEERFLGEYESLKGYHVKTEYSDDHSEYVYKTDDVLELSGSVNYDKRYRIKKCVAMSNISVRPLTGENIHTCLAVQEAWCRKQECSFCRSFAGCEKHALECMTTLFEEHIYKGLLLYQDDLPVGYLIGEKRNDKVVSLYFGKATAPDFFVYLIYMIAKIHFSDVECLNLNEDMGKKGLRHFKTHLSAHELWRKYLCTFTKDRD